jgi:hypothetical protein
MYGKAMANKLSASTINKYFSGRSYASEIEPSLYLSNHQAYLGYSKGAIIMSAIKELIGEKKLNKVLKKLVDDYQNKPVATTLNLIEELYKVTPKEHHKLINDWFKKVITYDLEIDEESSYKELSNGTFEVTVKVKAKRFRTLSTGRVEQISIDEPIRIGVFTEHPSNVKDDSSILYYESNTFNTELTEIKIIVKEKPNYISIDPYGTRSDENLVDNAFLL